MITMNPIINIANNHDDFVGIKLEDGIPYVSFPYGFELGNLEENPRELNKYILLLTKTISTTNSLIKKEEDISKKDSFSEDFPLYDYIWIISDYIDRGIYKSKEKVYHTKHKGKINWKKTLTGSFTISNNNVIYNNLIFEKDKDIDDEISKIHIHCLNVAYNLIGWLFGSIDIPHFDIINIDVNRFLLILQNKITKVFDDETKLLLTTMINILSNNKSVKSKFNIYKFGTDRFHIVWENIIDTLFSNTNINDYYPTAKYYLLNKDPKLAISSLRPDTLIIKDNNSVEIGRASCRERV